MITLDNRTNPVVALRTSLLYGVLRRLRVVPYFVGATYGARRLEKVLVESPRIRIWGRPAWRLGQTEPWSASGSRWLRMSSR
jgi:hypothetical protein